MDKVADTANRSGRSVLRAVGRLVMFAGLAAADVAAVQVYAGLPIDLRAVACIAAIALFTYGLNGVTDGTEDGRNAPARAAAFARYGYVMLAAEAVLLVVCAISLLPDGPLRAGYGVMVLVAVAYSCRILPVYRPRRGLGFVRLKDVPLVKNIAIGVTWAAGVFLPSVHGPNAGTTGFGVLAATFALTSSINSVFSDIKDEAGDRAGGIATLPVHFGVDRCLRGIATVATLWTAVLGILWIGGWIDARHLLGCAVLTAGYPVYMRAIRTRRLASTTQEVVTEAWDLVFVGAVLVIA